MVILRARFTLAMSPSHYSFALNALCSICPSFPSDPKLSFSSPCECLPSPSFNNFSTKLLSPRWPNLRCWTWKAISSTVNNPFPSGEVGDREILVQHLLVKDDDHMVLSKIQQRLSDGYDLGELAMEYSVCPSNEHKGILGWMQRGEMIPELEEATFSAPLNEVTTCKTKYGYHFLKIVAERGKSSLRDILPTELHSKLQDPSFLEDAQLIDVREPGEVALASITGFQVFPLGQFENWGPRIKEIFDTQKDTFVLCHHGIRSLKVAKWLQLQGYKRIFNVCGGIHAYAVKADASIPIY